MNRLQQTYHIITLGIILLVPFFTFGQNHNLPLNQPFSFDVEKAMLKSDTIIHSSFYPILENDLGQLSAEKKVISPTLTLPRSKNKSFVARKLFHEHFISLDSGMIYLTIDPLFNLELGNDFENDPRGDVNLFKNTRGFNVKLKIGEKVAVESSFRENQAVLPFYLDFRTNQTGVAYGQGRTKTYKEEGFDFAMASAYISYSPSNRINIQAGHGKHFIGNGHRSLLLSDLAFNYPYLRINTNWLDNKLQYQNLYTSFQELTRLQTSSNSEALFLRKQAAIHYLEYSPNSKMSFALFENTIFPSIDSSGNRAVGVNFWLPAIFLNTVLESSDENKQNLIGSNISISLFKKIRAYAQLAVSNLEFSDLNFQLGAKYFIHENVMLQGEFNSTAEIRKTALNHYNESLTTPLNNGANELIGIAQFKKDRWLSRGSLSYIVNPAVDIQFLDFRQSYVVNPSFNFTVHLGAQIRRTNMNESVVPLLFVGNSAATFVYFGLSTNLQNLYFNY